MVVVADASRGGGEHGGIVVVLEVVIVRIVAVMELVAVLVQVKRL